MSEQRELCCVLGWEAFWIRSGASIRTPPKGFEALEICLKLVGERTSRQTCFPNINLIKHFQLENRKSKSCDLGFLNNYELCRFKASEGEPNCFPTTPQKFNVAAHTSSTSYAPDTRLLLDWNFYFPVGYAAHLFSYMSPRQNRGKRVVFCLAVGKPSVNGVCLTSPFGRGHPSEASRIIRNTLGWDVQAHRDARSLLFEPRWTISFEPRKMSHISFVSLRLTSGRRWNPLRNFRLKTRIKKRHQGNMNTKSACEVAATRSSLTNTNAEVSWCRCMMNNGYMWQH